MQEPTSPQNPYRPQPSEAEIAYVPFAGRQKAFEHLYQQLTNPVGAQASVILGRELAGKTALLMHVGDYFDDTFISVYVPLKRVQNETELLRRLVNGATAALTERNFSMARLVTMEADESNFREWFTEQYLPELFTVIRRRKLVYLLDNAGALLRNVNDEHMPEDIFTYLDGLTKLQRGLGMVLGVDARYEDTLAKFSPLINLTDVFRLGNLDESEVNWLLREPVRGRYFLNDEGVKAAYRATGGQAQRVQQMGYQLYAAWEAGDGRNVLTTEDVKAASEIVYRTNRGDFEREWKATSRNGRLVLTAMTSLLYADPLAVITPETIEGWLLNSDTPLDMTAVNAALRGLEYREVIDNANGGLQISTGLMQTWLLENARLNAEEPTQRSGRRWGWLLVVGFAVLVVLLALIVTSSGGGAVSANNTPVPTVTLAATP